MATDPRKLASNDKHLQKLDRITFRLYKDGRDGLTKEQIEQVAQDEKQSAAAYIVGAIKARMEGGTGSQAEDTQKSAQEPQNGLGMSGDINIPTEAIETAQDAAERQGKPVPDWIANAIEAQAKRENMMGALTQAAAQTKENKRKIAEREK